MMRGFSLDDLVLSFLSRDWAGLAVAAVVLALGSWCVLASRRVQGPAWRLVLGYIVLGVGAVLALGAGYHVVYMARVRAQHPPPGVLIDVGGHRLHVLAEGEARGKPAIVWMPGAHGAGFYLDHLHRMLRTEARSILIDRPGSGWSDAGTFPRTTAIEAAEVVTVLERSGEQGPFVLVGHSLGGLLMANVARRRPDLVASLVLLDPTPPDAINYAPPNPFLSKMRRDAVSSAVRRLFGLHSGSDEEPGADRLNRLIEQRLGAGLDGVRAVEFASRSSCAAASIFEELAPGGLGWETTVYDGDLGDLPVFLVAPRDLEEFATVSKVMQAQSAGSLETARLHRFYTRARERYLASSTRAARVYAPPGTGHNFPYEAPEFVADVVRRALREPAPSETAR